MGVNPYMEYQEIENYYNSEDYKVWLKLAKDGQTGPEIKYLTFNYDDIEEKLKGDKMSKKYDTTNK
jgi:hypothetical protein